VWIIICETSSLSYFNFSGGGGAVSIVKEVSEGMYVTLCVRNIDKPLF